MADDDLLAAQLRVLVDAIISVMTPDHIYRMRQEGLTRPKEEAMLRALLLSCSPENRPRVAALFDSFDSPHAENYSVNAWGRSTRRSPRT